MTKETLPKISIVVVNLNGATHLNACLRSVFDQGYENLEVIMIDGGSTDGSLEIIEGYKSRFHYWISETDGGQYAAVEKGFSRSTGDVMAWINSDDKYLPGAFQSVAEMLTRFSEIDWLMGYPGEFDRHGALLRRISLPWARWSKWRYYSFDFQFIQQESCFWRRSLWEKAGGRMNTELTLAGDLELWLRFFRHGRLYTTITCLAGFRQHSNEQRSRAQRAGYIAECRQLITKEVSSLPKASLLKARLLRFFGFALWPLHFYEIPLLKFLYHRVYDLPPLVNYDMDRLEYRISEEVIKLPPVFIGGETLTRDRLRTFFGWKKK